MTYSKNLIYGQKIRALQNTAQGYQKLGLLWRALEKREEAKNQERRKRSRKFTQGDLVKDY